MIDVWKTYEYTGKTFYTLCSKYVVFKVNLLNILLNICAAIHCHITGIVIEKLHAVLYVCYLCELDVRSEKLRETPI